VVAGSGCGSVTGGSQLTREKFGVPVFREENGRRKVNLFLDIGNTFSSKEVTVQIIKENRLQVKTTMTTTLLEWSL